MSKRVYGSGQNPAVDHRLYRCSESSASHALAVGSAVKIIDGDGREAIQLVESAAAAFFVREIALGFRVSARTILAFVKTRTDGDKLHYEIPMAGDRTPYLRSQRRLIHVSGRSVFRHQAIA
jgi:hypothetical protein